MAMAGGISGNVLGVYPKISLKDAKEMVGFLTAAEDVFFQVNVLNNVRD